MFYDNKFFQADRVETRTVELQVGNIDALDINTIGYSQIEVTIGGSLEFELTAYKSCGTNTIARLYDHNKKRIYGSFKASAFDGRKCVIDVSDCEKVVFTGSEDTATGSVTVTIKYSTTPFIASSGVHILASETFSPTSESRFISFSRSRCDDIKFFAVLVKRTDGTGYGKVVGTVWAHCNIDGINANNKTISEFNTTNWAKTDWQENIGEEIGIEFVAAEDSYGGTYKVILIGIN